MMDHIHKYYGTMDYALDIIQNIIAGVLIASLSADNAGIQRAKLEGSGTIKVSQYKHLPHE